MIATKIASVALFSCFLFSCGEVVTAGAAGDPDASGVDVDSGVVDVTASYDDPAIQDLLNLPDPAISYEPELPTHFLGADVSGLDNTGANTISDNGATLGRVLFYDTLLSFNETISCSSCHKAASGFADPTVLSDGFGGGVTGRNSMAIVNLRYYQNGKMFWDERADSVEHQVLMPIQDSVEMGMALNDLVLRLQNTEHYPILFELAFGDSEVTSDRISLALGQFVRSMVSTGSRYDDAIVAGGNPMGPFSGFTQAENQGKGLFFGPPEMGGAGCAGCHMAPPPNLAIFQPGRALNNGIVNASDSDQGLGDVSGVTADDGLFKVPSLRNIGKTAPYMHNGSKASLMDVVEHYNSGILAHPNLDPRLKDGTGAPIQLNLSEEDKAALVAFLGTLTDTTMLSAEKFSSPFR
ncbi:MAG: cytochrome-c peroxidase [Kofleriaceae bacterium]|nr:cytochrome-c peroxidase [Kofleriaceae bacterium]